MDWNHLLQKASGSFYTEFFMEFISLLVIISFFIKKDKSQPLTYLFILSLTSLLQSLIMQYAELKYSALIREYITLYSLYIYLIIELTCSLLFISAQSRSVVAKKIITISIILFTLYTILYSGIHSSSHNFHIQLPLIEGLLVIISALYFFYELFTLKPDKNLFATPAFWSISGMLFLFTVISPIFLLINYFRTNSRSLYFILYTINNVAYSLLFTTFLIAIILDQKSVK